MYYGSINITELQSREILNLLLLLDELIKLQSLVTYIQEILIKDHYNFIIENVIEITELTYQKKSLDKLWEFCLQQICDNPDHLFKSTKFTSFNPSILEIILKRDDFYVDDEIIIWENEIKWTCGQQPVIQQNIDVQPHRKLQYGSTLIESQHFAIFSSWIEKKNNSYYNLRDIPYYFKLI